MFRGCFFALLIIGGFIALAIWGYVRLVPVIAGSISRHVPVEIEEQMGQSMYTGLKQQYRSDSVLTLLADSFANSMNIDSVYDIKVTVVDYPEVNAFAIPGGHIFIYTGLLDKLETKEELAALLSHESSHIILKHSLRSIISELGGYMLFSIFFSDAGALSTLILSAEDLKQLSYSRELETEADVNGISILEKNGIHPEAIISLLNKISSGESTAVPEFLSTHPVSETRIEAIKSQTGGKAFRTQDNPQLEKIWKALKQAS